MNLGVCLYLVQNSSRVRMARVLSFLIWDDVVMSYVYSYRGIVGFCFVLVPLLGCNMLGWSSLLVSGGCLFMGNVRSAMVVYILYSLSNTNSVLSMGDMWRAWYFHLGRWREPSYLADMYLVSPW